MRRFLIFLCIIVLILSGPAGLVFGQSATSTDLTSQQEAALTAELNDLLNQISQQQAILSQEQAKGVSYERDIAILNAQIQEAQLQIKAKQINIQQLGKDINTKTQDLQTLGEQEDQSLQALSQVMRKTEYLDDFTLPEIVLSSQDISGFLQDLDSYFFIKQSVNASLEATKEAASSTAAARDTLSTQQSAEKTAEAAIQSEENIVQKSETQKQQLLSLSKAQQANYQSIIADRQAKADAIRSALFSLRDTAAIPFGTALDDANLAYQKTGVAPAFILAILSQESDLGQNIGTCNRPGDPPSKSWKVVMKPTRDQQPFLQITTTLGLDPNTMPVSCPIGSGWGGAMGPSQFIPSTWVLYAGRIQAATGGGYPDPWNPKDAIFATAIYLSDLGASGGNATDEKIAADKYYAGGNWQKAANQFYGNEVIQKMNNIQENMIDPIENASG